MPESSFPAESLAVLTSGGLDSAILLARLAGSHDKAMLHPLYVRSGLSWEEVERHYLQRYLEALKPRFSNIGPLIELHQPVLDLYDKHWSITGESVPDENTPDEAVFLPGRNALLSLKALLWCHLHRINQLAIGVLVRQHRWPSG
jgi:7-cyano-7-deazaguanine synthase